MSLQACARLVQAGDPDRFLAVMAAPTEVRARLLPLYAFNLEVARAPWVTDQPLIAEMRLQFWRDVLAGSQPRAHEVAAPLQQLLAESGLDPKVLDQLIVARHWDIHRAPFADQGSFDAYIEATAAGLIWAAAQVLGAPPLAEAPFRALGWAAGLASFLRAVPQLTAKGRAPLVDDGPQAIRALAQRGLDRLSTARSLRADFGPAAAAALAAWMAAPILGQAAREPSRVAAGTLGLSEFNRRGRLMWMTATGRF